MPRAIRAWNLAAMRGAAEERGVPTSPDGRGLNRTLRGVGVVSLLALFPLGDSQSAVIGEPEREPVRDWAIARNIDPSVADARFAATGEVVCHWEDPATGARTSYSTGQITGARDILAMTGHPFVDPVSCIPKARPGSCTFTTSVAGEAVTATVVTIEAIGIDCGQPRTPLENRLEADWAVVRLDHPVEVAPYAIPSDASMALRVGTVVRSVVFSQDYLTIVDGEETHPRTVGDCTVRDVLLRRELLTYFTSDCDGAQRSSGGAILSIGDDPPALLGMWAASNEDSWLLAEAVARIVAAGGYRDDLANRGDYNVSFWSARHVPVTGAFLDALRAAASAG